MGLESLDLVFAKAADLLGLILGSTCPVCGRIATKLCLDCSETLETRRLDQSLGEYHGGVIAVFAYDSTIRQAILGFKYRNQRSSLRFLGDAVVRRVLVEQTRSLKKIDIVTWAPTTQSRVIERGYDHAELIARYIAKKLQVRCLELLTRSSDQPQTGKSRESRLIGPIFRARKLNAEHVLVFDDVVTTGATLNSASLALYQAGAGLVSCVAIASTVLWRSSTESCALARAKK